MKWLAVLGIAILGVIGLNPAGHARADSTVAFNATIHDTITATHVQRRQQADLTVMGNGTSEQLGPFTETGTGVLRRAQFEDTIESETVQWCNANLWNGCITARIVGVLVQLPNSGTVSRFASVTFVGGTGDKANTVGGGRLTGTCDVLSGVKLSCRDTITGTIGY